MIRSPRSWPVFTPDTTHWTSSVEVLARPQTPQAWGLFPYFSLCSFHLSLHLQRYIGLPTGVTGKVWLSEGVQGQLSCELRYPSGGHRSRFTAALSGLRSLVYDIGCSCAMISHSSVSFMLCCPSLTCHIVAGQLRIFPRESFWFYWVDSSFCFGENCDRPSLTVS